MEVRIQTHPTSLPTVDPRIPTVPSMAFQVRRDSKVEPLSSNSHNSSDHKEEMDPVKEGHKMEMDK